MMICIAPTESEVKQMIDTLGASNAISEAITAIGNGCSYEELRMKTIKLISTVSYLAGCIEGIQGEADDETGSD